MEKSIGAAAELLKKARKAVALTGAGVSTESGIPDFRSAGGLWSRFDPYEYGTLGAFRKDPVKVWNMLKELLALVDAMPNEGHHAMARLEEEGLLKGIVTQNIDGLHQKAGSRNVIEFHGSMATFTCPGCGEQKRVADVLKMVLPPECNQCRTILKPDIIFFDEQIDPGVIRGTEELLAGADLLIVVGTSCQVVPASLIPGQVLRQGGAIIEINREPALAGMAHLTLAGSFSKVMARLVAAVSGQ